MSKSNIKSSSFCLALGAILSSWVLLKLEMPNLVKQYAEVMQLSGERLQYQVGSNRRSAASRGLQLKERNQVLIVPSNNESWANLTIVPEQSQATSMMVMAGPDRVETHYSFPCDIGGGSFTIGWQRGRERACKEGVRIALIENDEENLQASQTLSSYGDRIIKTLNKLLISQPSEEEADAGYLVIKPNNREQAIARARHPLEINEPIEVTAIDGEINISFTEYPDKEEVINSGQRYRYLENGEGQVESFDLEESVNSPEFQEFLAYDNWASEDFDLDESSSLAQQLSSYRESLELPIEVASTPEIGRVCACLYPPDAELSMGEAQQNVYGVWETRQTQFRGQQSTRFVCSVPDTELPDNPIAREFPPEDCSRQG